jgi:hypothetical protein
MAIKIKININIKFKLILKNKDNFHRVFGVLGIRRLMDNRGRGSGIDLLYDFIFQIVATFDTVSEQEENIFF